MRYQFFILVILLLLSGCGGHDPRITVTGTVTFDGKPVERGEISFIPADPALAPEGGLIENGAYRVTAQPGKNKVSIRGSRPLPAERQPAEGGTFYEDYIPVQFNRETTLTADVTADERTFNFALPSNEQITAIEKKATNSQ